MKNRLFIFMGGIAAIVVAVVVAVEDMSHVNSIEPSRTPTPFRVTSESLATDETVQSIAMIDAGVVVIGPSEGQLDVRSVRPNPGWVSTGLSVTDQQIRGIFWNLAAAAAYTIELGVDELEISIETWESSGSVGPAITTSVTVGTAPRPVATSSGSTTSTTRPSGTTITRPGTTTTAPPTTSLTTSPTEKTVPTTTTTEPSIPTTTSATTTTIPAGDWVTVPVVSLGGEMVVSYGPGEVRLASATPAPGFELVDVDERSNRVEVAFEGDDVTYTLRAEWRDGALATDVDESD